MPTTIPAFAKSANISSDPFVFPAKSANISSAPFVFPQTAMLGATSLCRLSRGHHKCRTKVGITQFEHPLTSRQHEHIHWQVGTRVRQDVLRSNDEYGRQIVSELSATS